MNKEVIKYSALQTVIDSCNSAINQLETSDQQVQSAIDQAAGFSPVTVQRSSSEDLTLKPSTSGAVLDDVSYYYPNDEHFQLIIFDGTNWVDWGSPLISNKSKEIIVGDPNTGPGGQQGLQSFLGGRFESYGAGRESVFYGDPGTQLIKVHHTGNSMGQATIYVKHDGGGGSIIYQRTLDDANDTVITGGSIGLLGAVLGQANNQDDIAISGSVPQEGGEQTGGLHLIAKGGKRALFIQSSGQYIEDNSSPAIYVTETGGQYPFNLNGNLVIQPRTSVGADVIIATGNGIGNVESRLIATHDGIIKALATMRLENGVNTSFYINDPNTENDTMRHYAAGSQYYMRPNANSAQEFGYTGAFWKAKPPIASDSHLLIADGLSSPNPISGMAQIFVDSADGDLKIKFSDGTTKTITTDT